MNRTYVSPLREKQAEATRSRIVQAVARVLARGPVELSVPAVATEAGVSVATVYRHFATKSDLVQALAEHVGELQGTSLDMRIHNLDELEGMWRPILEKAARLDPALRLAMASPPANQLRRQSRRLRLQSVEETLEPFVGNLSEEERRRVRDLFVVLASSFTGNAFETLVGSSPAETATTLAWAVRRLLGADGSGTARDQRLGRHTAQKL